MTPLKMFLTVCLGFLLLLPQVFLFSEAAKNDSNSEGELILDFEDETEVNKLEIENIKNVKLGNQYFGNTHGVLSLMADFVKAEKAFLKYDFSKDDLKFDAENFNAILVDISKYSDGDLNLILSSHIKAESGEIEVTKKIKLEGKKARTLELPLKDKDGNKIKGLILDFSLIAENVEKKAPITLDYLRLK